VTLFAVFRLSLVLLALLPIEAQTPRVFHAETNLVVLHATVKNARGELVTNLSQDAFTVYDNGRRQKIALFRRDDIPVSLGLLIDNSGSMRSLRAKVEAAALACVRASNPQDEAFVLNFGDKPQLDVPFTGDQYTIAFNRSDQRLDGSYRKLRVVARGEGPLLVRARAGYWATPAPP